ncbi:MAG TPA: PTS sugar transporter subunit IIA [Planctomycetota bacterium]
MSLADHLDPRAVLLSPNAADKWALIDQLVDALVASGGISAERRNEARDALQARERSVSTGMEQGIAVPHAALENLGGVRSALAVLPAGLDFQSLDGQPARIVVLLLVPKEERITHVRTLTEVARRLGDAGFRDKILRCEDPDALVEYWRV